VFLRVSVYHQAIFVARHYAALQFNVYFDSAVMDRRFIERLKYEDRRFMGEREIGIVKNMRDFSGTIASPAVRETEELRGAQRPVVDIFSEQTGAKMTLQRPRRPQGHRARSRDIASARISTPSVIRNIGLFRRPAPPPQARSGASQSPALRRERLFSKRIAVLSHQIKVPIRPDERPSGAVINCCSSNIGFFPILLRKSVDASVECFVPANE